MVALLAKVLSIRRWPPQDDSVVSALAPGVGCQSSKLIFSSGALRPFVEFAPTAAELFGDPVVPGLLPLQGEGSEPAIEQGSVGLGRYSLSREVLPEVGHL